MDHLSNFISLINNGLIKNKISINIHYNKLNILLLDILYKKGFIRGYYYDSLEKKICVLLKYFNSKSVISDLKRVSKPGRRIYWTYLKLKQKCILKTTCFILSTNKGILTSKEALYFKVGGEVLFSLN